MATKTAQNRAKEPSAQLIGPKWTPEMTSAFIAAANRTLLTSVSACQSGVLGVALFPKEIAMPPRALAERGLNIARWTVMPKGGHFAAMEQPELLANDLREFFRPLR